MSVDDFIHTIYPVNAGPSIAALPSNSDNYATPYIAWTDHQHNILVAEAYFDNLGTASRVKAPFFVLRNKSIVQCKYAPSLASYKGKIYMAWVGQDRKELFIGELVSPTLSTLAWTITNEIKLEVPSDAQIANSPSLFVFEDDTLSVTYPLGKNYNNELLFVKDVHLPGVVGGWPLYNVFTEHATANYGNYIAYINGGKLLFGIIRSADGGVFEVDNINLLIDSNTKAHLVQVSPSLVQRADGAVIVFCLVSNLPVGQNVCAIIYSGPPIILNEENPGLGTSNTPAFCVSGATFVAWRSSADNNLCVGILDLIS